MQEQDAQEGKGAQVQHIPGSNNPFRQAEKLYMLHKPPATVKRRGKRAQQEQPSLDLSSVIDLSNPEPWVQQGVVCQHQVANITLQPHQLYSYSHTQPQQATEGKEQAAGWGKCCEQSKCEDHRPDAEPPQQADLMQAYTLPQRPGLLIIPAAVSPATQLALARAALTEYPEPPARTNHDREYGPLIGVWAAAQQGMLLRVPKLQHTKQNGPADPYPHASYEPAPQQQQHMGEHMQPEEHHSKSGQPQLQLRAQNQCQEAADGKASQQKSICSNGGLISTDGGMASGISQPVSEVVVGRTFQDCWYSLSGVGNGAPNNGLQAATGSHHNAIKAESMLRRMRWAVLGPHYDWTARKYLMHEAHRCLPEGLAQLAKHWGSVAHQLTACSNGPAEQHHTAPAGGNDQHHASYQPDGALVNFYYEGDTLMGHMDDAECDLTQPLVTVSVGCSAIMLVGGVTKQDPPHALLLHSGDVVVLSGHARRCYHGVPRVLTDRPLPAGLSDYICGLPEDKATAWTPFLQHLCKCRLNISVRVVT